ncbi:universal stress protein [Aliiglaciecola sp. LCG003]|uniref:universal stress protein n=1 Tax=Aliiglaciecola sp. LCG003 TaxID=3053655 RepID=UPI0025736EEF|nr:universal stress protein [Aliiglaciecola sp. LCG003]WJG07616.1 universal stress protein [Aliiglaciecola sp. LCG003]
MKRILIVIENEISAKYMLEKAIKFSPEKIELLCFDYPNDEGENDGLQNVLESIVKPQCETHVTFETGESVGVRITKLENTLDDDGFDMVMLHRPILGEEVPDYSLIKAILKTSTKATVFLCGDNRWKQTFKVLATVDLSQDDDIQSALNKRVVGVADNVCNQLTTELAILSVIPISRVSDELDLVDPWEVFQEHGQWTKNKMAEFVKDNGLENDTSVHVVAGLPQNEITSIAKKLKTNLVVIGNVGRTGIKGFIVGNTAEKILNRLSVDALIVRQ